MIRILHRRRDVAADETKAAIERLEAKAAALREEQPPELILYRGAFVERSSIEFDAEAEVPAIPAHLDCAHLRTSDVQDGNVVFSTCLDCGVQMVGQ